MNWLECLKSFFRQLCPVVKGNSDYNTMAYGHL